MALTFAFWALSTMLSTGSKRALLYSVIAAGTALFLWIPAVVSYLALHRLYLPPGAHSSAVVHFDYGLRSAYGAEGGALAIMPLIPPPAVNEEYSMSLELRLPRDSQNVHTGNFMIYSLFMESIGQDLVELPSRMHPKARIERSSETSLRALSLPFKDPILDMLDSLVFAPLYLIGLKTKTEVVSTRLNTLPSNKYSCVMIELDRNVTISSARLSWAPQWSGLRYLMAHYPISTFVIGVSLFWSIEMFTATVVSLVLTSIFSPDNRENLDDDDFRPFEVRSKSKLTPRSAVKASPEPRQETHSMSELESLGPDPLFPPASAGPDLTPAPSPGPSSSLEAEFDSSQQLDSSIGSDELVSPSNTLMSPSQATTAPTTAFTVEQAHHSPSPSPEPKDDIPTSST